MSFDRLLAAVEANDPAGVDSILSVPGAPGLVNQRVPDIGGRGHWDDPTLLIHAAGLGFAEVVRVLLKHGADPALTTKAYGDDWGNEQGGGETAKDRARSFPEVLRLLS